MNTHKNGTKKLYLVENYISGIKFDNDSLIIGLTPLACYQLGKAGIDYKIWEDYVDISGFANQYPEYYRRQKLWVKEFDEFLMDIFPKARLIRVELASAYFHYSKNVIDSLVLRAKELHALFEKSNPGQVIYVSHLPKEEVLDSKLLFSGGVESLFSRLAPLICKKRGLPFSRIIIPPSPSKKGVKKLVVKSLQNVQNIKKFILGKKLIKTLWNDFKIIEEYIKAQKTDRPNESVKTSILFVGQNSHLRKGMAEAIKGGYKVYYKLGDSIIRQYVGVHAAKDYVDDSNGRIEFVSNLERVSEKLKTDTNLINWLNQVCDVNVASIMLPRLVYFIGTVCPEVIFLTDKYIKFYDDLEIKFVFLDSHSTPADHAMVAACKCARKTKVGWLNHGDDAFDGQNFYDEHAFPYDIFLVSNTEMVEYLKDKKIKGEFNTNILQLPIRYTTLPRKKSLKAKVEAERERIIFVPTMYQWDSNFWASLWPDTWYFHWHAQLLKFFAERTDFEFIWKALPSSNETYDPILDIIREKSYPNVSYETEPFVNWISRADRFLSDYPSTALYEAAFAGLPVMSLYFAPFCRVRKTATEVFGKALAPFSTFNEGIQKISVFLDTDSSQFLVSIPQAERSFVNLLNNELECSN